MDDLSRMNTSQTNLPAGGFPARIKAAVLMLGLTVMLMSGVGCTPHHKAGSLKLESQSRQQGAQLQGKFTQGFYRFDDKNQLTMLLIEGPVESPQQAMTVRMFWKPRAGRTPIDPTATNATIHYVIFTGEERQEVGIYSGAGFIFPNGQPGDKNLNAEVWHSTLRLSDATGNFQDLLGPASLKGRIKIRHDDVAMERALRQLNINLRQIFGFPRLVDAGSHAGDAGVDAHRVN